MSGVVLEEFYRKILQEKELRRKIFPSFLISSVYLS